MTDGREVYPGKQDDPLLVEKMRQLFDPVVRKRMRQARSAWAEAARGACESAAEIYESTGKVPCEGREMNERCPANGGAGDDEDGR